MKLAMLFRAVLLQKKAGFTVALDNDGEGGM